MKIFFSLCVLVAYKKVHWLYIWYTKYFSDNKKEWLVNYFNTTFFGNARNINELESNHESAPTKNFSQNASSVIKSGREIEHTQVQKVTSTEKSSESVWVLVRHKDKFQKIT